MPRCGPRGDILERTISLRSLNAMPFILENLRRGIPSPSPSPEDKREKRPGLDSVCAMLTCKGVYRVSWIDQFGFRGQSKVITLQVARGRRPLQHLGWWCAGLWAFHDEVKMFAFVCFTVNANSSLSSCSTSTVCCEIRMFITRELATQRVWWTYCAKQGACLTWCYFLACTWQQPSLVHQQSSSARIFRWAFQLRPNRADVCRCQVWI